MTSYPAHCICPNCHERVDFYRSAIMASGKKCPNCKVKLIMPSSISSIYYSHNDDLFEGKTRLVPEFEKDYSSNDDIGGYSYPSVCPHGFWKLGCKHPPMTVQNKGNAK